MLPALGLRSRALARPATTRGAAKDSWVISRSGSFA